MRRLAWCLLLLWIIMAGVSVPVARLLGWRTSVVIVGGVTLAFTLAVAAASHLLVLIDWIGGRRGRRSR